LGAGAFCVLCSYTYVFAKDYKTLKRRFDRLKSKKSWIAKGRPVHDFRATPHSTEQEKEVEEREYAKKYGEECAEWDTAHRLLKRVCFPSFSYSPHSCH
jgi:hypothetical protein